MVVGVRRTLHRETKLAKQKPTHEKGQGYSMMRYRCVQVERPVPRAVPGRALPPGTFHTQEISHRTVKEPLLHQVGGVFFSVRNDLGID
jgi:hypothetical protein